MSRPPLKTMHAAKKALTQGDISSCYEGVGRAIDLVDCAYHATHNSTICPDDIGDPIRTVLDIAVEGLRDVKAMLHDAVEWVE